MTAEAAIIVQAVTTHIDKKFSPSPWRDRSGAAAYCACGPSTIDSARACGYIDDYGSESMPRFKTRELDIWVEAGMPTTPNAAKMDLIKSMRKKN